MSRSFKRNERQINGMRVDLPTRRDVARSLTIETRRTLRDVRISPTTEARMLEDECDESARMLQRANAKLAVLLNRRRVTQPTRGCSLETLKANKTPSARRAEERRTIVRRDVGAERE